MHFHGKPIDGPSGSRDGTGCSRGRLLPWGSGLLLALALACGGQRPTSLDVQPAKPTVPPSGTQGFTASAAGTPVAVTWSVDCGSITSAGLYTAPAAAGTCHVTAASVVDPSITGQATVTVALPPNVVSILPATPTVDACRSVQFTATTDRGTLSYAVLEGATGGSVSSSGLYTAPSTAGAYHVVASSTAGGSATSTVTVVDHILSVVVSPATLNLQPGGTGQFTATVTTSCGSFASVQAVQAPL